MKTIPLIFSLRKGKTMDNSEDRIAQTSELSDYAGSALSLCNEYVDSLYAMVDRANQEGNTPPSALLNRLENAERMRTIGEQLAKMAREIYREEVGL